MRDRTVYNAYRGIITVRAHGILDFESCYSPCTKFTMQSCTVRKYAKNVMPYHFIRPALL